MPGSIVYRLMEAKGGGVNWDWSVTVYVLRLASLRCVQKKQQKSESTSHPVKWQVQRRPVLYFFASLFAYYN
jgi:hypothetical protein